MTLRRFCSKPDPKPSFGDIPVTAIWAYKGLIGGSTIVGAVKGFQWGDTPVVSTWGFFYGGLMGFAFGVASPLVLPIVPVYAIAKLCKEE